MSALRHKWEELGAFCEKVRRPEGIGCQRPGCKVRQRYIKTPRGADREEYSNDNGQTWGDLKRGFSGRVPECKGGAVASTRIARTTPVGTTYEASFSETPAPELIEALDQVADAAGKLLTRDKGGAA